MLSAILLCAMAQVHATVTLDPVPPCQTCNALTARVAALEAQLAARSAVEPVRRVRLIEVSQPVRTVTYTAPLATALPTLAAWAPGSYAVPTATYVSPPAYMGATYVQRPGLFGGRMFGGRFSATSVCGPGGCP